MVKVAEASSTARLQRTDSLKQFGYYPVLGMNIFGRLIPIRGRILLGANRVKEGFFFAGTKPDHCFWQKECFRQELTHQDILGYVNWYREDCCKYTDIDGEIHTPTWQEHIEKCGRVLDERNNPLHLHQWRTWYVGTDYWMPEMSTFPDEHNYGYPECPTYIRPMRGKDGERKTHLRNCQCYECTGERRI